MLFGTTTTFLERLGLHSLDDLPPLGDFVPDATVVEALERGLHLDTDPRPRPVRKCVTPRWAQAMGRTRLTGEACRPSASGCRRCSRAPASGSRRACEELIAEGRVTVDGVVAVLGRRVDPATSHVEVDGVPVVLRDDLVYYLLNKPAGRVTTARDPQGRPTVLDLVPAEPRVFPVGRLDFDTEGLLVLTNDGDLTHRLTHPSHGVRKTYLAEVEGVPSRAALRSLREGVMLDDGATAPASVPSCRRPQVSPRSRSDDPRGAQPPGPPHVRGGGAPGPAARADADRPAPRPPARTRGVAEAHPRRGPCPVHRGRGRPGPSGVHGGPG